MLKLQRLMLKSTFDRDLVYLIDRCEKDYSTKCWNWKRSCGSHGYGNAYRNGKFILAHRFSHELFKGEIPTGYQVDHLCFNRKCINPEHLEAVTQVVNKQRANARKPFRPCPNGHGMEPRYRDKSGKPVCKVCKNLCAARYRAKLKKLETYQKEAH